MIKYIAAFAATAIVMVTIDILWLAIIARPMYLQGIGHLMAENTNIPVAILFYLVFVAGLMWLAVIPNAATAGLSKTFIAGALFGFFTYATYDLTNLATLKNWPIGLALIDIAWGTVVSAVSALAGKAALDHFAGG